MGLGLMLPKDLGLERARLGFFMTFEELGAQSIPSGMWSDCSHDIQTAVRMGTQQRREEGSPRSVISWQSQTMCGHHEVAVQ